MPAPNQPRIQRLAIVTPPEVHTPGQVIAGPGSEIEISFRLLPLLPMRATWLARILEFQQNVYFTDTQVKGPFKEWHHRHDFLEENRGGRAGTIIRDHVDYELGWGILGRLANIAVQAQIARMFEERHRRTTQLLQTWQGR